MVVYAEFRNYSAKPSNADVANSLMAHFAKGNKSAVINSENVVIEEYMMNKANNKAAYIGKKCNK